MIVRIRPSKIRSGQIAFSAARKSLPSVTEPPNGIIDPVANHVDEAGEYSDDDECDDRGRAVHYFTAFKAATRAFRI